jgi:type I pantothenate kinase
MELRSHSYFDRASWSGLRASVPLLLGESELAALRGANEPMSIGEVEDIFLPLVRLINLHVTAARALARVADEFVGRQAERRPYIIAIAGSVAVGKSTIARLLKLLLSRWPDHPQVELVTTDGFLWPTAKLTAAGLMNRKGFPESYDVRRMIDFLANVRAGDRAAAPVYSHLSYDIVPGEFHHVEQPDILIFEGLNVLQLGDGLARRGQEAVLTAADFFDLAIYIDADPADIERWYLDRFVLLQQTRMQDPASYFHPLAHAPADQVLAAARKLWHEINLPNLVDNIAPTRLRADVVLHKDANHAAHHLLLKHL